MAGIGAERLQLAWVSSAEAQRFVEVVSNTTDTVRQLGPLETEAHALQLDAAEAALTSETLRWMVGKEHKITTSGDVYGRSWDVARYEKTLDSVLEREYQSQLILQAIKNGCQSVRDIKDRIGIELRRISYLLADMEKRNLVEFRGMEACKPVFAAI